MTKTVIRCSTHALVESKLFPMAERRLSASLEQEPDDSDKWEALGHIRRQAGNLGRAAEAFDQALAIDPAAIVSSRLSAILHGHDLPLDPDPENDRDLRPCPFALFENFLLPHENEALLQFAVESRSRFEATKLYRNGKDLLDYASRTSLSLDLPEETGEWLWPKIGVLLPQVFARLAIAPFRVDGVELRLRAHGEGDFFLSHHDCDFGRRISFIYYFHRLPKGYSGGDIVLFDSHMNSAPCDYQPRFTRVIPPNNSLVFIPSHYFHEVSRIRCPSGRFEASRFSINGHARDLGLG